VNNLALEVFLLKNVNFLEFELFKASNIDLHLLKENEIDSFFLIHKAVTKFCL
jgi:hypothetical protein